MKKLQLQQGFTLIEVLIYIVLFSMLMGGTAVAAFEVVQGGSKQGTTFAALQEGNFISRKLTFALSSASDAFVSGGGKILTIVRDDLGSESPLVVDASGDTMTLKRGSGEALPLIGNRFRVADAHFEIKPASSWASKLVRVYFTLEGKPFAFELYLRN